MAQMSAEAQANHDATKQAILEYFGLPKGSLPGTFSSYEAILAAATEVAKRRGPPAKPVGRMPSGGHKSPAVVTRKPRQHPAPKRTLAASKAAPATTQKQRERMTKLGDDIERVTKLVEGVEALRAAEDANREKEMVALRAGAEAAKARGDYALARQYTIEANMRDPTKHRG